MTSKSGSYLRIISGKFRGRKIGFNDALGLRPTHDRIRETLFNWIQNDVVDSICLDLFAGSGALGLEALSRGAKHLVATDISKPVVNQIKKNIELLDVINADVICFNFKDAVSLPGNRQFNLVFLDPPFGEELLYPALDWLHKNNMLLDSALIYIEVELGAFKPDILLENMHVLKHKKTKTLEYVLCQYCGE